MGFQYRQWLNYIIISVVSVMYAKSFQLQLETFFCTAKKWRVYSDYYKVLGLHPGYSDQQLKACYLEMVRKYHPDLNKSPEARSRFQQIQEAYQVLTDPQKLKQLADQDKNRTARQHQSEEDQYHSLLRSHRLKQEELRKGEGMKFSYNLYKKHYQQVQMKKKQYTRYYGGDKEYFAKEDQTSKTSVWKVFGGGAAITAILIASIWFVNLK